MERNMKGKKRRKINLKYCTSFLIVFILFSCSLPYDQSELKDDNRTVESTTNNTLLDNQSLPVAPIDDDFLDDDFPIIKKPLLPLKDFTHTLNQTSGFYGHLSWDYGEYYQDDNYTTSWSPSFFTEDGVYNNVDYPVAHWTIYFDPDIVDIDGNTTGEFKFDAHKTYDWKTVKITVRYPNKVGRFETWIYVKEDSAETAYYSHGIEGVVLRSGPTPPPNPIPANPVYMSYPEKYYKDITGDGNNDLIAISGEHCYVVPWKNGTYDYVSRQYMKAQYFTYPWKAFKDINNDGYLDFIGISGTHCYTVPANSSGKFDYNARRYMNQIYFDYPQKYIYDTNGDGYLDFVGISGVHQYNVPGDSSCLFDYNRRIYINHS